MIKMDKKEIKHKYDPFCKCSECERTRKYDADLHEMEFVGGWK